MATATVDHHLHFDSLPLIDLRLLSQSDLFSLSVCSSSRASATAASQNDDEDEVSTPKIDRSVFNESAGSRKQTFSRLRLAPRNSPQIPPQIPYAAARAEALTLTEDNSQIVGLLESLFNIQSNSSNSIENSQQLVPVQVEYKAYLNDVDVNVDEGLYDVPISVVTCSARKRKRGRPRKDETIPSYNWWLMKSENEVSGSSVKVRDNADVVACNTGKRKRGRPRKNENRDKIKVNVVSDSSPNVGKKGPGRPRKGETKNGDEYVKKEIMACENKQDLVNETVTENRDGITVDLVALANMEDPFVEELRRRTEGSEKREELLGFLMGLKGVWVSLRKKRKIVDASEFGDALPKGWKLMLCIKKKVGHVWLGCRRYLSPNGRQFESCKEVSSYLLSLSGVKDAKKPSAAHTGDCIQLGNRMTFGNAVDLTLKDDKNGVDPVFHSPLATASISTGHENEATLPKIMSPGEVERQESCNKKYSVSKLTDAATEVAAVKLGVSLGAQTVLCNNQHNKHFGSSGERDVAKRTISREEISQKRVLDNSGNGVNISSVNNMNRLSASYLSLALPERSSESGLHPSSGNMHTCVFNNSLTRVSTSMLHEPKYVGVYKSENNELTIGFGNKHSVNKPGRPDDSEIGLLNLFGSEKIFGFNNNLTKAEEKIEVPKVDEVRNSSEYAYGRKNNYGVDTGMVQEYRSEDSHNARNSELTIDLSCRNRSGVHFMSEPLWRTDEQNSLFGGLTDTSSRVLQSSGCFPAFGSMPDKGVSELFSKKHDSISGFEELRPGSTEHMEYNFLTSQPSCHSEVSRVLPYDAEMSQGLDSSGWLEKEALPLLPEIGSRPQVTTVCAWCGNDFHLVPIDTVGETGSVGFMCPTCKAKFSGSHNPL